MLEVAACHVLANAGGLRAVLRIAGDRTRLTSATVHGRMANGGGGWASLHRTRGQGVTLFSLSGPNGGLTTTDATRGCGVGTRVLMTYAAWGPPGWHVCVSRASAGEGVLGACPATRSFAQYDRQRNGHAKAHNEGIGNPIDNNQKSVN